MSAVASRVSGRAVLRLAPCTVQAAKQYVRYHHRHNPRVQSGLFAVAVERADTGERVGVAIVGRPSSRVLQARGMVEITRVCTDGTPNACSFLIARARRAAVALGYRPGNLITYTLVDEGGASIRGAGLRVAACVEARGWADASVARAREDKHTIGDRFRWEESAAVEGGGDRV